MKKLLMIITMGFLLTACNKNNDLQTNVAPEKKLIKMSIVNDPSPDVYQYDDKGRLTGMDNLKTRYSLDYSNPGQLIIQQFSKVTNSVVSVWQCTLNAKGWVKEAYIFNAGKVSYKLFNYDNNGYLQSTIKIDEDGKQTRIEYTYENGNVSRQVVYVDDVVDITWEFTYTGIPLRSHYFALSELPVYAGGLEGKPAKNLIKDVKVFNQNNDLIWHTSSDYTLDADGYPASQVYKNLLLNTQRDLVFEFAK